MLGRADVLLMSCDEYNDDKNRDVFRERERSMIRLGMLNSGWRMRRAPGYEAVSPGMRCQRI